jgi:polar amino acid transport system substrate-binding protein
MTFISRIFMLIFCSVFSVSAVAADKVVTLNTLEWEPYIGENVDGKGNKGYVYDIVVEAFKRAGYEADIKFYPWARALEMVKGGSRDGLFPEYYVTVDWGTLSDPYPGGPVGLYKRKDFSVKWASNPQGDGQTEALKPFSKYKFGTVRGYTNTEAFDNAKFIKKDESVSDEVNLKKLHNKRVDFIFIDKFVARTILDKQGNKHMIKDLEFMEPAMEEKALYIQFSNKTPDYKVKLEAFNKGLKEIEADGAMEKIMGKYGFN